MKFQASFTFPDFVMESACEVLHRDAAAVGIGGSLDGIWLGQWVGTFVPLTEEELPVNSRCWRENLKTEDQMRWLR